MALRKSAEARRSEIVEAVLRLADTLGPDRLTTGAVAEAVGLTQPAVFRHFASKQELWQAVAGTVGTMMEARWAEAREAAGRPTGAGDRPATDAIRAVIGSQLRLIQSTPALPAILFSRELHSGNQGLRAAFRGLLARFHRLIAGLVARARAAGELDEELDAEDAAYLIVGLVQGLALRWSLSGRDFDLAREGERLLELQLRGFAGAQASSGRASSGRASSGASARGAAS